MTVAVFKLKSGEEIIAKYDETDTGYTIYKPMKMAQMMTPNGPQQTLVPWTQMFLIEQCPLDVDDVFALGEPPEQVAAVYTQSTTGIAVAAKPGIVLAR